MSYNQVDSTGGSTQHMIQPWEYLTLDRVVTTGGAMILRMNGQDIGARQGLHGDRKYPSVVEVINLLGEQGWELAGVDSGHYIFKRPRSGTPNERETEAVLPAEGEIGSGLHGLEDMLRLPAQGQGRNAPSPLSPEPEVDTLNQQV